MGGEVGNVEDAYKACRDVERIQDAFMAYPVVERIRSQKKPSYLVGAVAGAAAGAIAMDLYTRINPLFFGTAAELASAYIIKDVPTVQNLLLMGGIVGGVAGVVRTAVDRHFGIKQEKKSNIILDISSGVIAAPLPAIGKCMFFPAFAGFWKDIPFIFHALTCSAVGGLSAMALTPVSIAASTAARLANQHLARSKDQI